MSKLSEYSKFDHLDDISDDEGATATTNPVSKAASFPVPSTTSPPASAATGPSMRKNPETGRYVYLFNGNPIYEWEQSLEEVIVFIPAPPVPTNQIHCQIFPRRLQLGTKAQIQQEGTYFLDEDTDGLVDVSESTWTVEDGFLVIYLAKASKGQVWEVALKGTSYNAATLDPLAKEEVQKEMMRERFQEENPHMDFRNAEFNGSCPDPRTFMGGVKYS